MIGESGRVTQNSQWRLGFLPRLTLVALGLWVRTIPAVADVAVGGTVSLSGEYSVHTFTNVGTTNFTLLMDVDVDVLVVGGGGGGGVTMGGGGGGGGVLYQETYALTAGVYTVTVGQGGLGGYGYNNATLPLQAGVTGDNSSFGDDLVAIGGGGGAGWSGHPPTSGGSGGGGNTSTTGGTPGSGTEGQGHGGGIGNDTSGQRSGGGGGGADTAGANGIANAGGKGGDGREVFGAYYGGGGGGGVEGSLNESGGGAGGLGGGGAGSRGTTYAIAGTPGTGGGGGGAGYDSPRYSTIRIGGQGGSGIVIVRYMAATNLTVFGQAATEVGVTNAQVGAMVLGLDASDSAHVYIVWDTEDQGTNSVSDWLNVVDFGPGWANLQTFATNLWTLEPGTTYVYRAYATNSTGEAWSETAREFTTRHGWYVAPGGSGTDGKSWATAFTNLPDALNVATNGSDDIFMAQGEYDVDTEISWTNSGISILGGYEGVGSPGAYDATNWPTVIRRDAAYGSFRVMSITDVTDGRLARLTLANGNTPSVDARPAPGSGGGLRIADSSLEIVDCVISNNQANSHGNGYVWGGGLYSVNSTVTILRTLFTGNRARNGSGSNNARAYGGALAADGGTVIVLDSEFLTNYADAYGHHGSLGGAVYMESAIGLVSNTTIIGNHSSPNRSNRGYGGGILIRPGVRVLDCEIVSNRVWNAADNYGGGGVYMSGGLLRNSLVADNQASWDGGGIFASGGIIESVTVAGNRITEAGRVAGVFLSGVNPIVSNSIFAANIREFDDADVSVSDTGGTLAYSLTVPGRAGTNNVDADPEFVDPDASDYTLRPSSPAIDAAFEMSWMTNTTDLAGNARIRGDGPDMGCFEAPGPGEGPLSIGFSADTISGLDSLQVVFTVSVIGANTNGLVYQWDFDNNGTFDVEGSDLRVVTNTYTPGIWSVRLRMTNELAEEDILIRAAYIHVSASDIYVSPDGDGSDGLSWATAFTNIQQALNFASYSNTLYLAGRTFMVAQTINWAGHQDVRLQGGYEADPGTVGPGPRDSVQWPTIIARDAAGGTIRPLYLSGLDACEFEQITVTGGNTIAGGETPVGTGSGGGMRIEDSVLDIVDCVFSNNQGNASGNGYGWGGAVYSANSTVSIRGTRFVNNRARNGSGSNNARTLGGALAARVGTLTVLDCEFIDNDSDSYGHRGSWGGAIYTESVIGWIRNARVSGNRAGPHRALGLGGGLYLTAGMILENVTVASNQVWNGGTTAGGIYATGGFVTNSIVWNNENRTTSAISDVYAADLTRFAYTCASDLVDGENNNLTADPMFVDPAAGNYRLNNQSPCVDSGIDLDWMGSATDLAGSARILWGNPFDADAAPGPRVDRGAYEMPPIPGSLIQLR